MKKRSVKIQGHSTSISLEAEFWQALKQEAERRDISINHLIAEIDRKRGHKNLSSAIRIYILQAAMEGHITASREFPE